MRDEKAKNRLAGLAEDFSIWDGKHDHLLALFLAERYTSIPFDAYEHLEADKARERWLKVLRFTSRIEGEGRRRAVCECAKK